MQASCYVMIFSVTADRPCPLVAHVDRDKYVVWDTYEVRPCPDGTIYSQADCACVNGG